MALLPPRDSKILPQAAQVIEEHEIEPHLLVRVEDGQMRLAMWRLAEGPHALALFLSEESATAYRETAELDGGWRVFQPQRRDLATLLGECLDNEVAFAVLEPNRQEAKRVFDIRRVLEAAGLDSGEPEAHGHE